MFDFTHAHRGDLEMITELGRTLINFCNVIPDGVVCFFPVSKFVKFGPVPQRLFCSPLNMKQMYFHIGKIMELSFKL